MNRPLHSRNGAPSRSHAAAEPSPAALFALLWEALADLLGTATAATLLRRAARRAALRNPELADFAVVRESLEYRCKLPPSWKEGTGGAPLRALQDLVDELLPLLVELTGPVVVRHLAQVPELRERGIIPPQEEWP